MRSIILHILNEEPIMGECEELPAGTDQSILVQNPRRKDGKDIIFLEEGVTSLIVPLHRVNFMQIMPAGGDDEVIGFVRE